jgi:hypothetical protein
MDTDERVQHLMRHLREAGYAHDELRLQWRCGDHVVSDETLIWIALLPDVWVDVDATA